MVGRPENEQIEKVEEMIGDTWNEWARARWGRRLGERKRRGKGIESGWMRAHVPMDGLLNNRNDGGAEENDWARTASLCPYGEREQLFSRVDVLGIFIRE